MNCDAHSRRISVWQMFGMLFVTRAFLSVTYGTSENHLNVGLSALADAVSVAVQCVLLVPALAFATKSRGGDFLQSFYSKSKVTGSVVSLLYVGFFVYEISRTLGGFCLFVKNMFPKLASPVVMIAVISAVAVYASLIGIEGIARACVVGAFVSVVTMLIIICGVTGKIDIYKLQLATPVAENTAKAFVQEVFDKIGHSDELVCLPCLLCYVRSDYRKGTYAFLATKLAVTEIMSVYSVMILGEYATGLSLPFYTLSTYARTSVIERYDSIYMCVWSISTVLKLGVMIYLTAGCLENLQIKRPNMLSGAVPATIAGVLFLLDMYDCEIFRAPSAVVVIVLSAVIPLWAVLSLKKGRALNEKA